MGVGERQLRIAGVLENVWVVCDFVASQARELGLDERAIHHCYLAVDEACTNIIEHGYGSNCSDCIIDVSCQSDQQALTITIMDDSPPFDPLLRPDPDTHAPLSERGTGGWGIFFIKKLMDKVSYSYKDGRNHLVMVKKLNQAAQTPNHERSIARTIEMQALSDKVWVVTPSGRLDDTQSRHLVSALSNQLELGHRSLILNMAGVEYVSSAGLKMLVSVWQRVRDLKGDLVLVGLVPRVREVVQMIGLDLVFTITDTPDQARSYFASKAK